MTQPLDIEDSDAGRLLNALCYIEEQGFPAATGAFWAAGEGWTRERFATALAWLEEQGLVAKGPKT